MNSSSDRNWLIRTSQLQILGPVAKLKVIEFIQKGALGLSDEVSSGNGYWFHLREKDLVDKYLFGDVPQSYNPISEARTVLARKANPERTTSINASPANITQVINLKNLDFNAVPKNDDLEYPDMTLISTNTVASSNTKPSDQSQNQSVGNSKAVEIEKPISNEGMKLPDNNDLEYPDMDFISEVKKKANEDIEVKFSVPKVEEIAISHMKASLKEVTSPDLMLEVKSHTERTEAEIEKAKNQVKDVSKLYERKVHKAQPIKERPENLVPKPPQQTREIAPEFKNRNDSYLFIVLIVLIILIVGIIFYYYRFILNKPLPV